MKTYPTKHVCSLCGRADVLICPGCHKPRRADTIDPKDNRCPSCKEEAKRKS